MSVTLADLDLVRANVERVTRRPLRPAERKVDILKLDRALNQAKNDLERAIRIEMHRATLAWARRTIGTLHLMLTPAMRKPLGRLYELGVTEAKAELDRLALPIRAHRRAPRPTPGVKGLAEVIDTVEAGLPAIAVRIEQDLVRADLSSAAAAAIARALLAIPGARDIASQVVSTALYSGMGATFEEHEDLVAGWEWSSVLDSGTCDPCEQGDGTQYATWSEAQQDLPNGGPAVVCDGEGRCRCRLVPLG